MAKVLGLDLGTNSIGWALIDKDKKDNKLEDQGVLIFSEGVKKEKSGEKSRAAERTGFRGARRLNFRRKIRKYQTLLVLAKYDMCPLTIKEVKKWRESNFKEYPVKPEFLNWLQTEEVNDKNPYYFRDKASRDKIGKLQLGRALYHIAQRRGFLSNRLDQSDEGVIEKHQPELDSKINEVTNVIEIIENLKEFFEQFDILEKKSKELNSGEQKMKTLYNSFSKIIKEKESLQVIKDKLLERLYKKENLGSVKRGITELDDAIKSSNSKTLGQYFWKLYRDDRNNAKNKIRKNYTSREDHYLVEFEIICNTQGLTGIDRSKKDANQSYSGIVKELYKAIFYQRPLKSQKGLIGKCSLEPNRPRCSTSRPEFETFRMHTFINNIKIKDGNELRRLTNDEKLKIIPKFYRKSKPTFSFDELKNVLGKDHYYNYKDKAIVSGCPTIANLINVFGVDWKDVIFENYIDKDIKNRKTSGVIRKKTKDEVVADVWHVLSTYTSDEKLKEFAIDKLKVDNPTASKFAKIHLKKDYANLSSYVINKILPYLNGKKASLLYPHAVFMANMNKVVISDRWENKGDRDLIEKEIGKIIDNHQEENKIYFVINSILSKCLDKNNNFYYSKEAESGYKTDLETALKKEFGNKTWDNKNDKDEILTNAFNNFVNQLKERKRLKIKRIDDKVLEFLSNHDLLNPNALANLYHPSDIEKFNSVIIKDKDDKEYKGLGRPDVGSIKNPMAMRVLHQLKRLINTLIVEGQIDERTKINIELSRQLNDANKRKAIEKWQNDRKELYKIYADKIRELYSKENQGQTIENLTNSDIEKFGYVLEQRQDGKIITKEDVLKYNLWKEQNHICLYTGKTISLSSFLGADPEYDIEHTLPRSRSWDNSQKNKTLCEREFNRDKKGNKTPFELQMDGDILPRIQHWKNKYESLYKDIQKLKGQSRNASDKEQKDGLIQKRHYLQMEHDYWKGKYRRFTMEEIKEGFKNSQAVDIGIISKYARAYLKSVFNKVYSVKGEMVSEYRKAWGINITTLDENGKEIKDRTNHIHHCIDAVTIACMDKKKYDILAHAWGLEDKGNYEKAKIELTNEKPWNTFTQDVRSLKNEVFIVHHNKNVLPIQTKKKFRKRGKVQPRLIYKKDNQGNYILNTKGKRIVKKYIYQKDRNNNNIPIKGKSIEDDEILGKKLNVDYFSVEYKEGYRYYQYVKNNNDEIVYQKDFIYEQGDTVRGSLHQDTFYGAIAKGKDGTIKKDENDKIIPSYVVRKELKNLKKADVANIVDDGIRAIIEQAAKDKLITFNNNGAKVAEAGIWQNKEKQIPLKKVRIYTTVKSPLRDFKKHATPFLSKKEYKQQFNVVNDENYCMAIYEGENEKGKAERAYEIINNIEAGEYYKLKNKKDRKLNNISLIPEKHLETGYSRMKSNGKPIILQKGLKVLLLNDENEEFNFNDDTLIKDRLYTITGLDKDGIKVMYHQEGRSNTESIAYMNEVINTQKLLDVKDEFEILEKWEELLVNFKNSNIKKADVFKEVNQILNNYYKNSNILDEKGKLKYSKMKISSLTTPKGGDVINKHEEFPYIKFKVSNFNALIEYVDFKISTIGKTQKL